MTQTQYRAGLLALSLAGFITLYGFMNTLHQALVPPAEALSFDPDLKARNIQLPLKKGYWVLTGYDTDYKNRILIQFQDMLTKAGVPRMEQRWYVTQLYHENGSLAAERLGDNGCSFGIVQLNTCANHGASAKAFLKKYPVWKTVDKQLEWMVAVIVQRRKLYPGNVRRVVLHHNCPYCASKGAKDSNVGYISKISKKLSALSLL